MQKILLEVLTNFRWPFVQLLIPIPTYCTFSTLFLEYYMATNLVFRNNHAEMIIITMLLIYGWSSHMKISTANSPILLRIIGLLIKINRNNQTS